MTAKRGVALATMVVGVMHGAFATAQESRPTLAIGSAVTSAASAAGGAPSESRSGQPGSARPESGASPFARALGSNLRVSLDLSAGATTASSARPSWDQAVGIDLHKVFATDSGDWATAVVQAYVTRLVNAGGYPPFFDGPNDTELVYRILNVNVTRFGRGHANVRLGHFEIPFGLEHLLNTNGTLHDFMHGENLGLKADWGVGLNGSWPRLEYEATWSRGTGNTAFSKGDPYVVAGRVGTPADGNLVVGASVFHGRVWNPGVASGWRQWLDDSRTDATTSLAASDLTTRRRVGVDAQWYRGLNGVLGEVAVGDDAGAQGGPRQRVSHALVELRRSSGAERVHAYVQGRFSSSEGALGGFDRRFTSAVGTRFAIDRHWAVSGELRHVALPSGDPMRTMLRTQLRYRF